MEVWDLTSPWCLRSTCSTCFEARKRANATMKATIASLLLVLGSSRSTHVHLGAEQSPTEAHARARNESSGVNEKEMQTYIFTVKKDTATKEKIEWACGMQQEGESWVPKNKTVYERCLLRQGACHHLYWTAVEGFSGLFTKEEVRTITECFGEELEHLESDGTVEKTEFQGREPPKLHVESQAFPEEGELDDVTSENLEAVDAQAQSLHGEFHVTDEMVKSTTIKEQPLPTALWNLDRIDQRDLPLDKTFRYGTAASSESGIGVTIYVLDSGVRISHQEFRYWDRDESRASYGYNFVDNRHEADDCDGHGTHVAATAVGRIVGVAKSAKIVSVRVLGCTGVGAVSDVVAGLDWIAKYADKPAIVTMSLGIRVGEWSAIMEAAVSRLIHEHNIAVIVASGNSAVDACDVAPANLPETITVGASDLASKFSNAVGSERPYEWSNTGHCVDIFAPGVDVYSACGGQERCQPVTDDSYTWASGTSMAVPLVAGVVANIFEAFPSIDVYDLKQHLLTRSTVATLQLVGYGEETPNRVLYSRMNAG